MATLEQVKNALGIVGNFQDATLQVYFDEVVGFLVDAGVREENITSGIVARGAGEGTLSPYFLQRAIQLAYKK